MELPYSKDTCLFLFSDGYPDQFGGKGNKKISYKTMTNLLTQDNTASMADRKAVLENHLDDWMQEGKESQIDDILVIGIQLA